MPSLHPDFRAGVRDVAPTLPAVVPYGLVAGAAAVDVGLSAVEALGMSVIVFAGASQLAAIALLGAGAPAVVVVLTALVVNLRLVMYSAAMAPSYREERLGWRATIAYLLVDQLYVMAALRFDVDETVDRRWYVLGLGIPIWLTWVVGTAAGALAGASVPTWLPLDFAVPMVFLALLVPAVGDRSRGAAAAVAGGLAIAGAGLPYNLGLLAGAVGGVGAGLLADRWWNA
jgi:4-azaleucine resistance transporter AzlC